MLNWPTTLPWIGDGMSLFARAAGTTAHPGRARKLLGVLLGAVSVTQAPAQSGYPSHSIRIVVPIQPAAPLTPQAASWRKGCQNVSAARC